MLPTIITDGDLFAHEFYLINKKVLYEYQKKKKDTLAAILSSVFAEGTQ